MIVFHMVVKGKEWHADYHLDLGGATGREGVEAVVTMTKNLEKVSHFT